MGIGAKIKDALHGDHQTDSTTSTTSPNKSTPGAFPSDDLSQRHSDGKEYVAPHGSMIGRKDKTTGASTGQTFSPATSGTYPNKLRKGGDEYEPAPDVANTTHQGGYRSPDSGVGFDNATGREHTGSKDAAYWGDLAPGHGGHGTTAGGLPDRSRLDDGAAPIAGRPHGGTAGQHNSNVPGSATRHSPLAGDTAGATSRRHDLRHGDQAVGGGTYNSVTGAGSPEHGGANTGNPTGFVHDPLTSGTKGVPISSGHGNAYDQKTGLGGEGLPTTRNNHTGLGLAGAGTAAGAGAGAAAGYGAHGVGHQSHGSHQQTSGVGGNHPSGVPRSSMLDPEPALGSSTTKQPGFNSSPSQPGLKNSGSPTIGHSTDSPSNTHASSAASPSIGSGGGLGRSHFGPGHEGSKVLHTCQHCGRDNDISQYFSKDVVYRLGS